MSLPVVAIIGRPNVGKSRLFNRLAGKKKAIVSDIPGTTRDRIVTKIEDVSIPFVLVDTGGLEFEKNKGTIEKNMQDQVRVALEDADIILFVLDSRTPILPQDYKITELLRKSNFIKTKHIIPVLSKCDEAKDDALLSQVYSLGFDNFIQVSAIHNTGVKKLVDRIQEDFKKMGYSKKVESEEVESDIPKISFLGRPNVGKSSLINALLSEERLIVSDIPGTTRDEIDVEIQWEKKKFIFVDTAGMRRRGKVEKGIEKWSIIRTMKSMEVADVSCIIINADEGILSQDQHIIERALEFKTGLILVINKWDLHEKGEEARDEFLLSLKRAFPFLSWTPAVFVSAKTKQNIIKIFPLVEKIVEERKKRITTGKLNTFLHEIMAKHPPKGTKRIKPKIFYISQVDINPPKFKVFVNKKEYFHFSYWRYLENRIREYFGFEGTVIDIEVEERKSLYQK